MSRSILAFSIATLLSASALGDEGDHSLFTHLMRRVATKGAVHELAIADHPGALGVAAIADKEGFVSVVVLGTDNWTILKLDQEFEMRPRVALHDLDGDGICELLTCGQLVQAFKIVQRELRLVWTSPADLFGPEVTARVDTGDFDGDGRTDVVALNYKDDDEAPIHDNNENVYVFLQQASDELQFELVASETLIDEHGYYSNSALSTGRFTGGQSDQIAVGNSNGFLWLLQLQDDELTLIQQWKTPVGGAIGPALKEGNLDQDSAHELMVGTNGGNIYALDFDEQAEVTIIGMAMAGRMAYGVNMADLDGDGIDELICSRGTIGYAGMTKNNVVVEIWKTTSGRALKRMWTRTTVDSPRTRVHDIDGDGDVEIIVYSGYGRGEEVDVLKIDAVDWDI